MSIQLNEFIKVADTAFALRLLRLMTMPVEKTGAYKAGIIDKDYKRIKDKNDLSLSDKKVYTMFHKLAFNLRKLIRKVPLVGKLSLSSYLAALWLIKDHTEMSDEEIRDVLTEVTGTNTEDIPLVENSLYINKNIQNNNWIGFLLEGKSCNRDAIGCKIILHSEDNTQVNWVNPGGSYLTSNDKRILFGVGKTSSEVSVEIIWPDSKKGIYSDLKPNNYYKIIQGENISKIAFNGE